MRQKIKLSFNIVYVIIGCILIGFAVFEKLDSFWSGMGSALLVVGLINLLKIHRLNKNEEYRKNLKLRCQMRDFNLFVTRHGLGADICLS